MFITTSCENAAINVSNNKIAASDAQLAYSRGAQPRFC